MPEQIVTIPMISLLPHQQTIASHPARFKVVRAGRRFGKDRLGLRAAILGHGDPDHPRSGLVHGRDIVWLAPDYPQARSIWDEEIRPRFDNVPGTQLNNSEMTLRLIGKGNLYVRSAESIEGIRGLGARLGGVVINEAAHLDLQYAWRAVLRPALVDNRGWALIMSTTNIGVDGNVEQRTPSYFNTLCRDIESGKRTGDWAQFTGTAHDNPILPPEEIQELIEEYPPDSVALQQEVYAKLLESGNAVAFPEWREAVHVLPGSFKAPGNWSVACGLDWGSHAPGAFLVMARDPVGFTVGIDELYFQRTPAYEMGLKCALRVLHLNVDYVSYDASMDNEMGMGHSLSEEFRRGWNQAFGANAPPLFPLVHGPRTRATRANLLHTYLAWKAKEDGSVLRPPRLVFSTQCQHTIRTLPTLVVDPHKPEQVDTHGDDHCVAGNTPILTADGWQPISAVPGSWATGIRETVIVAGPYGRIECTPDHEMLTMDGWCAAADVRSPILWWSRPRSRNGTADTGMAIAPTIAARTWSPFRSPRTWLAIPSPSTLARCAGRTPNGSIAGDGSRGGRSSANATGTGNARQPFGDGHVQANGSGRVSAPRHGVKESESLVNHGARAGLVSRVTVRSSGQRRQVYDIGVDHALHGFVAGGGFVVSNCFDALCYYLMSRHANGEPWPVPVEADVHPGFDVRTGERRMSRTERNWKAAQGLVSPRGVPMTEVKGV